MLVAEKDGPQDFKPGMDLVLVDGQVVKFLGVLRPGIFREEPILLM
jgi:hypothetical protein